MKEYITEKENWLFKQQQTFRFFGCNFLSLYFCWVGRAIILSENNWTGGQAYVLGNAEQKVWWESWFLM